jgi:ppGpp synthetase/RelA/SpoT-type nucleotidyltranferase
VTDAPLSSRYEQQYPRLERLATELITLLREAFRDDERIVLIEARAKKPTSFLRKADAVDPGAKPKYPVPLVDIQDQIGCRLVVRSPAHISDVIGILQRHFNSIENQPRPARIDPTTFGYEAWHLICLLPHRKDLKVEATTFEIQISTPFQYAWTVMEHDLLYKPDAGEATYEQKRAVHAAAALAYAADQLFELAQPPVWPHAVTPGPSASPRPAKQRPRARPTRKTRRAGADGPRH